ncbi:MAG: 4-hydroxybenzoate octaprenyltransferase [Chitinophagia bacterium]|nr:4-hydroxybenzoate octaprenyltransferase [Chitinophagia bacterium]
MVRNYLSLVKFSHTIFAMPFAMVGFTLAAFPGGVPAMEAYRTWVLLAAVVVCMVTARSAAMAFNRWLDRHFDAKNPRTAIREIPAGIVSPEGALRFTILMSAAFAVTTAFINPLCLALSPVALAVVLGYSYTKRFTPLCHLVLGVGLSLAPIGAFLAVTGAFAFLPVLFSLAVLCWVSGFDIIYALQDVEFDRSQGLNSIPARLGVVGALRVSRVLHLLSAAFIVWAGMVGGFGAIFWVGAALFCAMLVYQQSLVSPDDLSRVNLAFMTANGVASVVFGVLAILDILHLFQMPL